VRPASPSPWTRAALAGLAILAAPSLPRAEIKQVVQEGEVVFTNVSEHARAAGTALSSGVRVPSSSPSMPAAPPDLAGLVSGSASRFGFDPALIQAVIAAESAFDHRAVSKKGARGLMQLMPDTARQYGVRDLHDPASNLEAGIGYLRQLVLRFNGDVKLALAAYNAGPEAVARYGGVPPYEETRVYLDRIRSYYGDDLQKGDITWSSTTSIRFTKVEEGGVPFFTNVGKRRIMRANPKAAAAGVSGK
jgi:soluble lytic murein transglycosylase-like protein